MNGGGWTVFQRRKDGSVDFFRTWINYAEGFGDLLGEFWLGLDKIHRLTEHNNEARLRIDLRDKGGVAGYAEYSMFVVNNSSDSYRLLVEGYSGTVGDSLSSHSGELFTTKDRDNDDWDGGNNAVKWEGAWWYHNSHHSNLNGRYNYSVHGKGINWGTWKPYNYSLPFSEMKVQ